MTLRDKLRPLWANYTDMYAQVAQQAAMGGALAALTEYAGKMERAGQPHAALGAVLMAEQLRGRAEGKTLGADARPPLAAEPTDDLERECADADRICAALGLTVEQSRTEGGSLNVPRIVAHINETLTALRESHAFGVAMSDRYIASQAAERALAAATEREEGLRRALAELVACKDIKDQADYNLLYAQTTGSIEEGKRLTEEYRRRKVDAWRDARAALAAKGAGDK